MKWGVEILKISTNEKTFCKYFHGAGIIAVDCTKKEQASKMQRDSQKIG